jgi:hypothetical protein
MIRGVPGFVVVAISLIATGALASENFPMGGLLYNQQQDSSLRYDCTRTSTNEIQCKFLQTDVRKKASASDLPEVIENARKQFPGALSEMTKSDECQTFRAWTEAIKGTKTPEEVAKEHPKLATNNKKFIDGLGELRRRYTKHHDELDVFEAMNTFCEQRDEESYLNVARTQHERDMRTCNISSTQFTQTFTWAGSWGGGQGAWVAKSTPDGPCGAVDLSRFELDPATSSHGFWRYYARKTIANPQGKLLDMECSKVVDENTYLYDWTTYRDGRVGCEFIEFH